VPAIANNLQTILVKSVTVARREQAADRSARNGPAAEERRNAECEAFAPAAEQIRAASREFKIMVWDKARNRPVPLEDMLRDTSIVLESIGADPGDRLALTAEAHGRDYTPLTVAHSTLWKTHLKPNTRTATAAAAVEAFFERIGPFVVGDIKVSEVAQSLVDD